MVIFNLPEHYDFFGEVKVVIQLYRSRYQGRILTQGEMARYLLMSFVLLKQNCTLKLHYYELLIN